MKLPSDMLRIILFPLEIKEILSLCLVSKNFNDLCSERQLWIQKFTEKNLEILDVNITNVSQYFNEYKKISHAAYTINCLFYFIETNYKINRSLFNSICGLDSKISSCDILDILRVNHPVSVQIRKYINDIKYIDINIQIDETPLINYNYYDENYQKIGKFLYYENKDIICDFMIKILYYFPLIQIIDINYLPLIINNDMSYNNYNNCDCQSQFDHKKKYWDECYIKYKELYF